MKTEALNHRGSQLGLSLIELMISITIGLILMVTVMQIFLSSKQSYRVNEANSRVQENGRYAIEALSRDIRMAGYLGCSANAKITNNALPIGSNWVKFNQAVIGFTPTATKPARWGVNNYALITPNVTEVLQIQGAASTSSNLTGNMGTDNANIQIAGNPAGIKADDILIIADCSSADVFRANSVSSGGGTVTITHPASTNTSPKLSKAYASDAELLRLVTNIYYVGNGTEVGGCPLNMLCREFLSGTSLVVEQLVDNVVGLTFLYGVDTETNAASDGVANKYVASGSIVAGTKGSDWPDVVSIRYSITIRSPEGNVTTTGGPIQRTFGATVAIRNNIPKRVPIL